MPSSTAMNLDGRVLDVRTSGDQKLIDTPYSSIGRAEQWECTATPRDHLGPLLEAKDNPPVEQFESPSGTITLLRSELDSKQIFYAFWQGRSWGLLFTNLQAGSAHDASNRIAGLKPSESEDGVAIQVSTWDRPPSVRKFIAGAGLLNCYPPGSSAAPPVPSWSGTKLGEFDVYRNDGERQPFFVFAGDGVVGTFITAPENLSAVSALRDLSIRYRD